MSQTNLSFPKLLAVGFSAAVRKVTNTGSFRGVLTIFPSCKCHLYFLMGEVKFREVD